MGHRKQTMTATKIMQAQQDAFYQQLGSTASGLTLSAWDYPASKITPKPQKDYTLKDYMKIYSKHAKKSA